jgi:hypothetical protein
VVVALQEEVGVAGVGVVGRQVDKILNSCYISSFNSAVY